MAVNYTALQALVQGTLLKGVTDNIYNGSPVFARLQEKAKKLSGGSRIEIPVTYKTGTSGFFSASDTFNISPVDQDTKLIADWKHAYANISITGEEEALIDGGSQRAVESIIEHKVELAMKDLRQALSAAVYSDGSNAKSFEGLEVLISDTGLYGGIDRAVETWLASTVDATDYSAATLATNLMDYMRAGFNSAKINLDKPSLIVTTQDIFDILDDITGDKVRYNGDQKLADLGFENLKFKGAVVVPDDYCPDNYMYFINEDYMDLYVHETRNFQVSEFVRPADRDMKVAQVIHTGNLVSRGGRFHSKMTGLGSVA